VYTTARHTAARGGGGEEGGGQKDGEAVWLEGYRRRRARGRAGRARWIFARLARFSRGIQSHTRVSGYRVTGGWGGVDRRATGEKCEE